jgi:hypothetical protein
MDVNLNISSRLLINGLIVLIRRRNEGNNVINTTNGNNAISSILISMRLRRLLDSGRNINIPNGYTRVITNDNHSFYIHNDLL